MNGRYEEGVEIVWVFLRACTEGVERVEGGFWLGNWPYVMCGVVKVYEGGDLDAKIVNFVNDGED